MKNTNLLLSSEPRTLDPRSSNVLSLGLTADWHLRHNQFSRKIRGQHFFQGALSSLEKSHEAGVKYVINSGDILDRNRQRTCNVRELIAINQWLVEHGMTMYTITGNHDLDSPTWLETLFGDNEGPGIVAVDNRILTIPGTDLTIGGIPTHDAQELLKELKTRKPQDLPKILVWHGGIDGFMGFSAYKVTYQDLLDAAPGIILFAIGDLHLNRFYEVNGRIIGYPGSTEMCSISENPEKKVTVIDIENNVCRKSRDLVLNTTPVFTVQITSEQEKNELVDWRRLIEAEEFSLIRLIYSQEYVDAARSFTAMLDEKKTIIRRKRLSTLTSKTTGKLDLTNTVKSPVELVNHFVAKGSALEPYILQLANKHHDPRVVVEKLIQDHAPEALKSL